MAIVWVSCLYNDLDIIDVLSNGNVVVQTINSSLFTPSNTTISSDTISASSLKGDKPDSEGKTYDTLDSLLLNLSPGFMRRVNERLEERLWSVFAERETHEANEIEERE